MKRPFVLFVYFVVYFFSQCLFITTKDTKHTKNSKNHSSENPFVVKNFFGIEFAFFCLHPFAFFLPSSAFSLISIQTSYIPINWKYLLKNHSQCAIGFDTGFSTIRLVPVSSAYFRNLTPIWNRPNDHVEYADIMQSVKTVRLISTAKSRFILFSDAHRGDGTGADDFAAKSLIFTCASDISEIPEANRHRRKKFKTDSSFYNTGSGVHPRHRESAAGVVWRLLSRQISSVG